MYLMGEVHSNMLKLTPFYLKGCFLFFKWIMTLYWLSGMSDLQWYPFKLCLIKYELVMHTFTLDSCFHFCVLCLRNNEEIIRIKHFSNQEHHVVLHIIIKLKFQGHHCESDMSLFKCLILTHALLFVMWLICFL